ncbi:hypothetical protein GOP47_0004099 [Adiantum capillus-veneris]|uniref:Ferredoxin n=1 Tax=Adiantum capillus-veneris TaxID=13818 RepID=A0A9D4V806_ADICA|nr:hypothetical protein GOP47_0004099 [Adiantum capillus-veneris]
MAGGRMAARTLSNLTTAFRLSPSRVCSSSAPSTSSTTSRLVSERIVELTAIDVDGIRHNVKECRVMVATEWLEKLPPRSEDEYDTLVAAASHRKVIPQDRLGCQIVLNTDLRGMVVAVPEPKPWRIP